MLVVWLDKAADDLEQIDQWLRTIEAANPERARKRIGAAINSLERLGDIGRPSSVEGLRELSVRDAPYVIVYRMSRDLIEVHAIYHTSQDR